MSVFEFVVMLALLPLALKNLKKKDLSITKN